MKENRLHLDYVRGPQVEQRASSHRVGPSRRARRPPTFTRGTRRGRHQGATPWRTAPCTTCGPDLHHTGILQGEGTDDGVLGGRGREGRGGHGVDKRMCCGGGLLLCLGLLRHPQPITASQNFRHKLTPSKLNLPSHHNHIVWTSSLWIAIHLVQKDSHYNEQIDRTMMPSHAPYLTNSLYSRHILTYFCPRS